MSQRGPDGQPGDDVRPDIRARLRQALREALKARDTATVSALRSALGAIGNAEAVDPVPARPPGTGGAHFAGAVAGLGAAEAERRPLTEADVAAIVRAEAAEREAAASEYERSGHLKEAALLRRGTRGLIYAMDGADPVCGADRRPDLLLADPAVRAGRLTVEIMTWYCPPGTMSRPGRMVTV